MQGRVAVKLGGLISLCPKGRTGSNPVPATNLISGILVTNGDDTVQTKQLGLMRNRLIERA